MREYLGAPHGPLTTDDAAKRLAMHKMAFEVAWRIQRATPVNATALVSALLLSTRGVALTLDELHDTLQDSLDYLERKQTPMTNSALRLRTADGVRAALDALSHGHPVTCVDGGREPVWRIAPEDEHEAAFYRNTLIDVFLETSIVELALAYSGRADGDRLEAFWSQAMRLRDLRSWCRRSTTACSTPSGYRALRLATVASGIWAVCVGAARSLHRLRCHGPAAASTISTRRIWWVTCLSTSPRRGAGPRCWRRSSRSSHPRYCAGRRPRYWSPGRS